MTVAAGGVGNALDAKLVSVVIPVRNGAAFIAQAIDGVVAQTYDPIEIVVVDDASTDATASVVENFGRDVVLVREKRIGMGASRNCGVARATGSLIAFLDADDLWLPEKIALQVAALEEDPRLDAVFTHVEEFGGGTESEGSLTARPGPLPGHIPSTLMVRRSVFERVGGFGQSWNVGEWVDWWVRAIESEITSRMLDAVLVRRRIHAANQGRIESEHRGEYARAIKASLDRRRAFESRSK